MEQARQLASNGYLLVHGVTWMLSDWVRKVGWGLATVALAAGTGRAQSAQDWMSTMLAHENAATSERGRYLYLNVERSERSGGHLWMEWVAETNWGKVRYLVAEDGKPLPPDRVTKEKARVADEAAHPDAFKAAEDSKADSEQHARQMLSLLPKAFILSEPRPEGDMVRIDYVPNPSYQPSSMEEKVLHAMSGSVLIDQKQVRMRQVDGHMSQDVSMSFGLASIKAGSNFLTERVHAQGPDWKLGQVKVDIRGKALLFKIARSQESTHTQFRRIPDGMTVAAAVEMLEQQPMP